MNARNDGQPRTVANRGVTSRFRELLERAPGKVFFLKDLMEELQAPEVAVQNCAARAVREHSGAYKVHIAARAWVYSPNGTATTGRRMFEELAVTNDGSIIIQDESGSVYKAVAL